ncbi:hypothetical protein ACVWXO_002804 [Bradyrhizobium sp. LM2.7]
MRENSLKRSSLRRVTGDAEKRACCAWLRACNNLGVVQVLGTRASVRARASGYGPYSTSSVSVRSASRGGCGPLKYLRPRRSV